MAIHKFFVALASLGLALSASAQEAVNDAPRVTGTDALNADLDGNGTLDAFDYVRFQSLFAAADPGADLDGSGTVDLFDVLAFHNAFSKGPIGPPEWLSTVPPGEWCATFQRYAAGLEDQGGNIAVVCAPNGACDDPAERNAAIPDGNTPIKTYRLSIHVLCDDFGSNCLATEADVDTAVARLNADFAPWRIQFIYQWHYVSSTKYRILDDGGDEYFMKKTHADSPATKLNVYVVDTGGGCWGTFPFFESPDPLGKQGGIVMHHFWFAAASPIPSIFTHEVGHCLGLWHIFHGTDEVTQCGDCYEAAGRTPEEGDITGDKCSDTNPTPKNSNNCFDPAGTDPCNGIPWLDTPYPNFMSYSHICPPYEFTPQQAGRMHCWTAEILSGWLDIPAPPAAPGTPNLAKIGGGVVRATWADNSGNETGFRVQRGTKSGGAWINQQIVATVGANTTSADNSPGAGTFRYRVQAFNGIGDSSWSGWTQIKN